MRARLPGNSPIAVLASRVVAVGLGFISAPILARSLGPEGRGMAAAALAVVSLLPVVIGSGVPLVVRRRANDPTHLAETLRTVRLLSIVGLVPGALIGLMLSATLLAQLDPGARAVFVTSCSLAPAAVLWICDANILLAQHRLAAYAAINIITPFVFVVALALGWLASAVTVGFVIAANLAATLAALLSSSMLVRVPVVGSLASPRPILKEGISFAGSQLAEASSYRLDQAVALPLIGSTNAGLYAVAATIAMVPHAVGQAVGSAVYRQVATTTDAAVRGHLMACALRYAAISGLAVTGLIALLVPWGVPFLFGEAFAAASVPTLVALAGSVMVVLGYVASSLLTALGRGWFMTVGQTSGLVVGIGLLVVLGPGMGALGAAIASSLGYLCTAAVTVWATRVPGRALLPRLDDVAGAARLLIKGTIGDSKPGRD